MHRPPIPARSKGSLRAPAHLLDVVLRLTRKRNGAAGRCPECSTAPDRYKAWPAAGLSTGESGRSDMRAFTPILGDPLGSADPWQQPNRDTLGLNGGPAAVTSRPISDGRREQVERPDSALRESLL